MNRSTGRTNARPTRNDLIGFHVESVGGPTGTVDAATRQATDPHLVIKTGRWPLRHRVVIPAGAVNCVDPQRRRLWVERDRDQVRAAPAFDQTRHGRANPSAVRTTPAR